MLSAPAKFWALLGSSVLVLTFCWFFRLDLVIQRDVWIGAIGVDSDQYLSYVNFILDRNLSYESQVSQFTAATLTRTPGYPLFLIPVVFLSDLLGSFPSALVLAHATAWVFAALFFSRTVGRDLGLQRSVALFLIASLIIRPYAFQLMSDWLAIMVTTIACCYFWAFTQNRKMQTLFLSLFSASCTVLIRPDYFVLVGMILVGGALVIRPQISFQSNTLRSLTLASIAGVVPLGMLLGWNVARFGCLTIIPREGHLYELASILGPEPHLELDSSGRSLLRARQAPPQQATNGELLEMITLEPQALNSIALNNLGLLEAAQVRSGVTWLEANRVLATISKIYIQTYPERYAFAILCGVSSLLWGVPAYLIIVVSFLRKRSVHSIFGLFVALFHVLHICGVSLVHIVHARYYLPSASLLIAGALVCLFSNEQRGKTR